MLTCSRIILLVALTAASLGRAEVASAAAPCWRPPVVGVVVDPFRAPPCTWCAGNRGLEYRVDGEVEVRAAASGRVAYAGTVVDVGYVVVELANGWRHTYGRLIDTRLDVGDLVLIGGLIGRADTNFFFGLRIDGGYADPAPFLGSIVGRPRLIPVDGSSPRPAPPPSIRCQVRRRFR